ISKSLPIFGIVRALGIERPAVVRLLNLAGNPATVGIPATSQQLPGSQPPRVEVRQIAARTVVQRGIGHLLRLEDAVDIEPGAGRDHDGQTQSDDKQRTLPHERVLSFPLLFQSDDKFGSVRLMLQLWGHEPIYAMAHRSLGGNRHRDWLLLLVSDETLPSGRGRLPLGAASRAWLARWAKSLRYAVGTISADGGAVRAPLRAPRAGSRGGDVLGDQLFPAGLR